MGRSTKLTEQTQNLILQVISVGGTKTLACKHAGITLVTLQNWLHRGKQAKSGIYHDFYLAFLQAEARPDILAMGIVHRAVKDGDVAAARWWLEKKAGWGQPKEPPVQISISHDQMNITQLIAEAENAHQSLKALSPPIIDLDEE